jgi:hypothetical protein
MRTIFSLVAVAALMSGCATEKDIDYTPAHGFSASDQGLVAHRISAAVGRLMESAERNAVSRGEDLGKITKRNDGTLYVPENRSVIVTTPVSINREDVAELNGPVTNQFGRNTREIIVASIGARFRVIEPRASTEITMKSNEGEFTLNRDLSHRDQKSEQAPADLIVAGSYTESSGSTQLNLTVLRGQEVLAATTVILPFRADLM